MRQPRPFFVTGTDTEVGKTLVSSALLRMARARGLECVGIKPIAAGCELEEGQFRNEDALELMDAAKSELAYEIVNPIALQPPIAPHIALKLVCREVRAAELARQCNVGGEADFVLIEGAGGWLVPLNSNETIADFCIEIDADVILVVGMKLGCLNHALLTSAAIKDAGLNLAGWVANCMGPNMPFLEQNVETLIERLDAPHLGTVPHIENGNPAKATHYLRIDELLH